MSPAPRAEAITPTRASNSPSARQSCSVRSSTGPAAFAGSAGHGAASGCEVTRGGCCSTARGRRSPTAGRPSGARASCPARRRRRRRTATTARSRNPAPRTSRPARDDAQRTPAARVRGAAACGRRDALAQPPACLLRLPWGAAPGACALTRTPRPSPGSPPPPSRCTLACCAAYARSGCCYCPA